MALAFSLALLGCEDAPSSGSCEGPKCVVPPDPCPDRNPLRNLYVGELHIHSSLSFDAELAGDGGHLEPDVAGADDHGVLRIVLQFVLDRGAVGEIAKYLDSW